MRKLKRILTSFLAVALVLSNLSFGSLTVNAAEVDDTVVLNDDTVSGNEPGDEGDVTVSENEPGDEGDVTVSENEPGDEPGEGELVSPLEANILVEYNTSFEGVNEAGDLYWWNDANWSQVNIPRVAYGESKPSADCGDHYVLVNPAQEGAVATLQVGNPDMTKLIGSGQTYDFSYLAKLAEGAESGDVTFAITGISSDWNQQSYATVTMDENVVLSADEWKLVTGTFVLEDAKDQVQFKFTATPGVAFCIDDLRVDGELPEITEPEAPAETEVKTYTADELTFAWADPSAEQAGEEVAVKDGNKWVVNFRMKQYAQVAFNIPDEIDLARISQVKFTVADQNIPLSFKLLSGGSEVSSETVYGKSGSTEYVINTKRTDTATIDGVGLMVTDTPAEDSTASLVSVEFTVEPAEEGDSLIYYGENIVKNPYFADEDVSMWDDGVTNATISTVSGNNVICEVTVSGNEVDEVTTYGVIDRDPEYVNEDGTQDARHEFFLQDVTDSVKIGSEYKVEFWAKLSDDYADAPEDQRVVEFAPYLVTEQDGNVYLGASYSSQLSGKLRQTLNVGEWTKFSGTFKITHAGAIQKVVIRIIEQGTEYGDITKGSCVKGDYYLTGVSMTEIIKPKTEIETDIPNWKVAITEAFGDDAIAGTCLGSGTLTYDYLQELAKKHFNAITFENEMKPDITLGSSPKFDEETGELLYNFNVADSMMAQIKEWNDEDPDDDIDFKIRGHVLVWHSQTPEWFFHKDYDVNKGWASKDEMNAHLEHYIKGVFEHYNNVKFEDGTTAADMFYGWDVVNEAMSDNTGKPRKASDNSNWAKVYGDESNEYIINAFKYANKYAPEDIELYYNDYNDSNEPKASGIAQLVKDIKAAEGTRIDGVGMQAHHNFADPTVGQIKTAINNYLDALGEGGTVMMTEFDVKASSSYDPNNLAAEHNKQAWRFKEIFDAYRDIEAAREGSVGGITMWGITDETSWLQSSNSVGGGSTGGTHAPLLFFVEDYVAKAKPAFYAFFEEYLGNLEPMIQDITVMQQMEEGNFDIAKSYAVADVAQFTPMWNEEGLVVKVAVADTTSVFDNTITVSENAITADYFTIYTDVADEIVATTVSRNAEDVVETENGYEAIVKIPMATGSAVKFKMDVVVADANEDGVQKVTAFNDKKGGYAESSQYYAEAIMKPYAVIQGGTAVVDGEYDEVWDKVDAIPLTISLGAEASATVKALWDTENLYIYADVTDADLDATSSQVHEKDSIEVFIDENNAKADSYQADDKQYRINYLGEQSFNGSQCTAENVESKVKLTENGYVVEASFAWTDIVPVKGMEIGLEFQINDGKGGTRIGTTSWYDTTGNGWSSPAVFGTVVLDEAGFSIGEIDDYVYTGKAITPEVDVYDNYNKLIQGVDYTIKATNNTNVGVAKATLTGKGNYAGTKADLIFSIVPKDLASEDITVADVTAVAKSDGTVKNPTVTVKFGKTKLKENRDFAVDWSAVEKDEKGVVTPGTYDVVIKAVENTETAVCNFAGTKTIKYTIYANTDVAMSNSNVKVKLTDKVSYADYQNEVRPTIAVTYKNVSISENVIVDWPEEVVVGKNNVVTVNAKDDSGFYGSKTAKFEVTGTKLENKATKFEVTGILDYDYTGKPVEQPGLVVVDKTGEEPYTMVLGTDYELVYAKNINVGTASVTIKGINAYTGTIKKSFKINKVDLAVSGNEIVIDSIDAQTYTGKAIKPAMTVTVNDDIVLTSKDYTAKYTANTAVGTAKVKLTLKGSFKGTAEAEFVIIPKALTDSDITKNASVNATMDKKGNVKNPALTVKMGKTTLKAGRDYDVTYPAFEEDDKGKLIGEAGSYNITVVGKGNFAGEFPVPYDVLPYGTVQMSKVTIKAPKISYTDYAANKRPEVTVTYGSGNNKVDLVETEKATVSYPDAVAIGKNNVITVSAKTDSGFYGSKTIKFEVTGTKLSTSKSKFEITGVDKSYTYTGTAIKPAATIKDVKANYVLKKGVDYTVSYKSNVKVGKSAKVVITGIGAYSGKIEVKFEIKKENMTFQEMVANFFANFS